MNDCVLEVRNITKKFPGVVALSDVSFEVHKGEVLGLIGENGAGKSTLLKVINGVYPFGSYEGELKLHGKTLEFRSPINALECGIGFVPQEINVMEDLSVAENIYVGHLTENNKGFVNMSSIVQKADAFLKENGFTLDASAIVGTLSIGQKQLLMVAKALSWNPDIVILDEPTTALSQSDVENLFKIVRLLKSSGKSVIFVTHKLAEIFELTDRVTILRDGHFIKTYEKSEYDEAAIISGMVGRELTTLYPARNVQIGEEVLSVENLVVPDRRVEGRRVVDGVSFTLHKGECLGLVGLVGSGRTEIVTGIFGGYSDASGDIKVKGEKVNIKSEAQAIKLGINMLTEDRKGKGLLLLNDIKFNIVLSNLKKMLNGLFLSNKKELEIANKYMESLAIKAPSCSTMAVNLSGGNQQKVVLARALNSDPDILILDEPTKGVDVGAKQEIYTIMNELLEKGISIIMISSELPEMLGMCDRFIVIAGGKRVGEYTKEEATQEKLMSACFV